MQQHPSPTMETQVPTTPTRAFVRSSQWTQQLQPDWCHTKRMDTSVGVPERSKRDEQHQWQSTTHLPQRRMMVQRILQLSQTRPKSHVASSRAVLLAKRIELALYSRAGSLSEYSNLATLQRRLQSLVASNMSDDTPRERIVQNRKRRVVSRSLIPMEKQTKRQRYTSPGTIPTHVFATIGEDCTRLVFSFLDGKEVMRHRMLNRFAAAFLPSCVRSLTVEVTQVTQGLAATSSSMLQMTNLQQLVVHKAGASIATVGYATAPLYAWECAELPTSQSNNNEGAVLALAAALRTGTFVSLEKLRFISVVVSPNGFRALCNALGSCPVLKDLLLAGNSLADVGATEVAQLLQSAQAPRLTRLDLRRNFIGETGLRAVLSAVAQTQSSLQVLCMGGNLVTDNCVSELQNLLACAACPSLRFLGLEDNFLSAQGVQQVLKTAAMSNILLTRRHHVSSAPGAST